MKATKALKRLTKIDSLITDLAKRFKGSPEIQGALQDTRTALARIKLAITSQASAEKAAKASSKQTEEPPKGKLAAASKAAAQEGVEAVPARRKTAAKTMVAKSPVAITAKKRAPKKNAPPKKTLQAPVEIPAIVETDPASLETATTVAETNPSPMETASVPLETTPATVQTAPADVEVQSEPPAQMSVGH